MGTTDDLFVRNDVPLIKEEGWDAGEALGEKFAVEDEAFEAVAAAEEELVDHVKCE